MEEWSTPTYFGWVAIIIINHELQGDLIEHDSDPNIARTWADIIQPVHATIPRDAIRGRYITVKVSNKHNKHFYLTELYAPADGPAARDYFYRFTDTELTLMPHKEELPALFRTFGQCRAKL